MEMNKFLSLCFFLLLCFACTKPQTESISPNVPTDLSVPEGATLGLLRVKFSKEMTEHEISTTFEDKLGNYKAVRTFPPAGKYETRHREAELHLWYDISFDESLALTKAAGEINSLDGVALVEFDVPVKTADAAIPFDDPSANKQWHYLNNGNIVLGRKAGCDINVVPAWAVTSGDPNVIVAIDDAGVDFEHEDLANNMWVNEAEYGGTPGVDDDNNGYIDDIHGFNFTTTNGVSMNADITPGKHGTHVAGTVAAVNNNAIGVCGIAGGNGSASSGVRIMSLQTINDDDEAAFSAAAIVYAADMGASIVNCSWSFTDATSTPPSILSAIQYFNTNAGIDVENGTQFGPMVGGLMIFAAGNDNKDICYPAMEESVIAVASIAADYTIAYYSNYGSWVDISAPGGDAYKNHMIYSTVPNNSYDGLQGTSMAAPHVTGVAALALSSLGGYGFTRQDLIDALLYSTNRSIYDSNPSYEGQLGTGMVDAYAAVTFSGVESPKPVTDLSGVPSTTSISLSWTVPGLNSPPQSYTIFYSKSSLSGLNPSSPSASVQKIKFSQPNSNIGDVISYTIKGLEINTSYHIRVTTQNVRNVMSTLSSELELKTLSNTKPVIKALDGTELSLASHEFATLSFSVSDADNDELSFSLNEGLDGLTSKQEDGVIKLYINALQAQENKTYNGVLTVTDGTDDTKVEFSYFIKKNNAPTLKSQMDNIVFDTKLATQLLKISDCFADLDGETLTYKVLTSNSDEVVRATISAGQLSLNVRNYGSTTVTVSAQDARGAKVEQSFIILVRDGKDPFDLYPNPVIDNLYVRAGAPETISILITNKSGAVIRSISSAAIDPFAPYTINLKELPGGIYYIKLVSDGSEEKTYSIVKQ